MQKLPVPNITLETQDQGSVFQSKMNSLASACKTAVEAYNEQIDAAQTAQQYSEAAQQALKDVDVTPVLQRLNMVSKAAPILDFDFTRGDYTWFSDAELGMQKKALSEVVISPRATAGSVETQLGLKFVSASLPRITFDYNTGACLGLLCESSGANMFTNSVFNGLDNENLPTGWSSSEDTGSTTSSASPRYSAGKRVVATGTAQRENMYQQVALAAATAYTVSCYFDEGTDATDNVIRVTSSDTPSGTLVLPASSIIQSGVYSISFTTVTGGNYAFRFGLGCNGNATGTVIYETPQLETGSTALSYNATGDNPASRDADGNYTDIQSPSASLTIFVSGYVYGYNFMRLLEIVNTLSPTSNVLSLGLTSNVAELGTYMSVLKDGQQQVPYSRKPYTIGTYFKVGLTISPTQIIWALNGEVVQSLPIQNGLPNGLNRIYWGRRSGGNRSIISRATLFYRGVTASELARGTDL